MNLPKIDISIDGVHYDNSFNTDVSIDRTNLDEEFSTQAEKYAFYAFLAANAKSSYERNKFALEQIYAAIDHEKRTEAEGMKAANPKFKYTEKMVESEVITDKRYTAKKHEMFDARLLADQLSAASAAIAQRKDMLVQLGLGHRTTNAPTRAMEAQQESVHTIIRENKAAKEEAAVNNNGEKPKQRRRSRSV